MSAAIHAAIDRATSEHNLKPEAVVVMRSLVRKGRRIVSGSPNSFVAQALRDLGLVTIGECERRGNVVGNFVELSNSLKGMAEPAVGE